MQHNTLPVKIGMSTDTKNGALCLEITDDGIGYPPEILAILRGKEANENAPHILGLHVVEQIAAAHGGKACFAQNEPCGAKATVWLPLLPI